MTDVVVTACAEGLTQLPVISRMCQLALHRGSVRAGHPASGVTSPSVRAGRVDRTEARSGQRDEDGGPFGHRGGHILAPGKPRMDEVPGISGVEVRTGWADDLTPVLTANRDRLVTAES